MTICNDLRNFLMNELNTRDLGTLSSLKLAVTNQILEARADSCVLMWPESRKPLSAELTTLMTREIGEMTQLEVDVSNIECFGIMLI